MKQNRRRKLKCAKKYARISVMTSIKKSRISYFYLSMLFCCCLISPIKKSEAGWFWPSSKEECIQRYVPKTKTDMAANFITHSCRDYFESKNPAVVAKAKCFLNLRALYKAQNNMAARYIHRTSKCAITKY